MNDLGLTESFEVSLDHRNDLQTVDGREEFEQSIAVQLTDYMYDLSGEYDLNILKQKIRYQVNLVAQNHDMLDSIESISVEKSTDELGKLETTIRYTSSESFSTSISQ